MKRAVLVSIVVHAVAALALAATRTPPAPAAQVRVQVAMVEKSVTRPALPPPAPKPEAPRPSRRMARAMTPVRASAPSPQPVPAPPPPSTEAARPAEDAVVVAGIALESTSGAGTFTVAVGNTLHAAPGQVARDPGAAKPYKAERYAAASDLAELPEVLNRGAVDIRRYYPKEALHRGVEGEVILRLTIDADGSIAEAAVVKDPGAGMGPAALRAVREFRFAPGKASGVPVATSIPFVIRFVIS
jgi:periplasmic protein TonB